MARFPADPTRQGWELRAIQLTRSPVEHTIAQSHCDPDTTTLTRGRPYTLVCTKNLASYARRLAQRDAELGLLERL